MKKTVRTGYFMWFLGLHYFYVNKTGTNILFWITGGGFLIWWLFDLFRVPLLVGGYNKQIDELMNREGV